MMTANIRSDLPFDIDRAMTHIEEAVQPYPEAALFELAEAGHNSPFEQLVACIISIRTRDEVTLPCARQLFAVASTPAAMLELSTEQLERLIDASTFHENKTSQILEMARTVVEQYDGALPCDLDVLTGFRGVGPKCANLVLGIACDQPCISVDVHVHRITNRWGYVQARTPEQTRRALEEKLPRRHWVDINRLLVPFGKHICTGRRPRCSMCPLRAMCQQVGVDEHR